MSIEAIVKEFSAVAANPKGQLKAYKDAGKKCIGVMPYYAPEELVYAAGMMPFGMWGSNSKTIQRAKEYSRAAVEKGVIPVTPHIYLTQFMDDNVPEERELALKIGSELVLGCSELWAFGIDHPSAGMAAEIELATAHGIPVRNGFEAISELKPDEELENSEEDKPDIGSVTLHLPAFRAMAVCNQHLDHGPISIELDGSVILELADRLISDPGVHIEIGG